MNNGSLRFLPIIIGMVVLAGYAAKGCREGPFGRSQIVTISPEQELSLGRQAYTQVLTKERGNVIQKGPIVDEVREVGNRLRRASEDPAIRELLKISKDLRLDWEFNIIQSKQINAFCLPGGKVAIYTGILPVCQTDTGLAVVMGHEIGHALARHGAERMAQQQMVAIGQLAVASSIGNLDYRKQQMVLGMLGVGAQVGVLLPFSRNHESEADHIGIVLMAAAGYDPAEAPIFWERMGKAGGGRGPEFLSTHPNPETRVADLRKWMSEAMAIYDRSPHVKSRPLPAITYP